MVVQTVSVLCMVVGKAGLSDLRAATSRWIQEHKLTTPGSQQLLCLAALAFKFQAWGEGSLRTHKSNLNAQLLNTFSPHPETLSALN